MILKNWTNNDNKFFYEHMTLEDFYNGAVQGGLDTGSDVKALAKYIRSSNSILECGAGYGRVLTHIVNLGYQGELCAIERSKKFYQFLNSQFYDRAHIFHEDVYNFNINHQFDLILCMWTGLCEFSKKEQLPILSKFAQYLGKDGLLIIDIIPITDQTINAIEFDMHNRVIQTKFGNNYGYFPSPKDLHYYAKQLNLEIVECLSYKTNTNKIRHLYIIKKHNFIY